MSDIKYLLDGTACQIIETLKSGLLVAKLYEHYSGEDVEPMADTKNPIVVNRVFDNPPTEKKDERVKQLELRIKELEEKRRELDLQQRQAEADSKAIAAKLAKFDQLKLLMDFIDGKITHYVSRRYREVEIAEFKHEVCQSNRHELKLLTLFGSSKGDLQWKLSTYHDGSGSNTEVWPATSRQEALEIAQHLIIAVMETEPPSYDTVKCAEKHGVVVPDEYRKSVKEQMVSSVLKRLDDLSVRRNELDRELKSLQ